MLCSFVASVMLLKSKVAKQTTWVFLMIYSGRENNMSDKQFICTNGDEYFTTGRVYDHTGKRERRTHRRTKALMVGCIMKNITFTIFILLCLTITLTGCISQTAVSFNSTDKLNNERFIQQYELCTDPIAARQDGDVTAIQFRDCLVNSYNISKY